MSYIYIVVLNMLAFFSYPPLFLEKPDSTDQDMFFIINLSFKFTESWEKNSPKLCYLEHRGIKQTVFKKT